MTANENDIDELKRKYHLKIDCIRMITFFGEDGITIDLVQPN